jgi:hypothetical protein
MDQNTPCAAPQTSRATASSAKFVAAPEKTAPAAKIPTTARRRRFLGQLVVQEVNADAVIATVKA